MVNSEVVQFSSLELGDGTSSPSEPSQNEPAFSSTLVETLKIIVAIFPRAMVVTYFVLLLLWTIQVEGSYGFDYASTFSWHALLMSMFGVLFMSETVIAFVSPLVIPLKNNFLLSK